MAKKKIVIAVVNGHGKHVKGKHSPKLGEDMNIPSMFVEDGRFKEWKYTRIVAKDIVTFLTSKGYDARLIVPEDDDIQLRTRASRINKLCKEYGESNVLMLEIHANANGSGNSWDSANGWELFTTVGKTKSDVLGELIYKKAVKNFNGRAIRKDVKDGDMDKEKNFYLIKNVKCPAILSENFFYTNKKDLEYMTSELGLFEVVRTHVEATMEYIESLK